MPITYPRPIGPDDRYVLFRISTGETINANAIYPEGGGDPVPGLDPDLVYLHKVETARPDYDPRYFIQTKTETPNIEDGIWNIVYGTTKRDLADIEVAAANVEANANQNLLPYERQLKTMILGLGVLFRQLDAQTLTAKETAVKDQVMSLAVKVWRNDDTLKALLAQITSGEEPDLDNAGWEES